MSVLINEFEIVPPSEGEAGQRPAEAAPRPAKEEAQEPNGQDVYTLMRRREERLARVWAH